MTGTTPSSSPFSEAGVGGRSGSLDLTDDTLRCVLLHHLWLVEHVELLRGVSPCEEHDSLLATRVVMHELSAIEHLSVHDHPAVVLLVVLRNLGVRDHTETTRRRGCAPPCTSTGGPCGRHGSRTCRTPSPDLVQSIPRVLTRNPSVHHTVQEGVSSQSVRTVHTPHHLSCCPQVGHRGRCSGEHTGVLIHVEPSHGVVEDGGDDGDVEEIVHLPGKVGEELFPERTLLLTRGDGVVVLEGRLDLLRRDAHLGCQLPSRPHTLHQTPTAVVLAVPLNLLRGFPVQNQTIGTPLILPHSSSHVVSVTELISESVPLVVQQHPPHTPEGLCCEEFDFRVGFLQIDQTGRVDLNLLHVHCTRTDGSGHLDTVSGAVLSVGGGQMEQVGTVDTQKGVGGKVSGITAGGDHDQSRLRESLALSVGILDATHSARGVGEKAVDLCLGNDAGTVRGGLGNVFELLHQGVCDGHPWEPLLSAMGALEGVASETGDEGQVQVEGGLQPFDCGPRVVGECLDERGASQLTG
mmetsp:Transcript_12216/g.23655  ORF Transcript_12216/g.23655 Transcript_12216/m.23655 type:complete len:521 (-) Transcript_12216:387-1949(-)